MYMTLRLMTPLLLAAMAGRASLVLVNPVDIQGTGIGAVNTILTMQSFANGVTSQGCVGWNGTADVLGLAMCRGTVGGSPLVGGNEKTGASQTKTVALGAVGITDPGGIHIIYNPNEPQAPLKQNVTLMNLVLQLYAPDGTLLFSSTDSAVYPFPTTDPGVGNAGFHFALDGPDLTLALAALAGYNVADVRAGLSAMASEETGGFETFFIVNAGAPPPPQGEEVVPEPGTWAMLVSGLVVIGWRRFRR